MNRRDLRAVESPIAISRMYCIDPLSAVASSQMAEAPVATSVPGHLVPRVEYSVAYR